MVQRPTRLKLFSLLKEARVLVVSDLRLDINTVGRFIIYIKKALAL